jgi:hypothetical protein
MSEVFYKELRVYREIWEVGDKGTERLFGKLPVHPMSGFPIQPSDQIKGIYKGEDVTVELMQNFNWYILSTEYDMHGCLKAKCIAKFSEIEFPGSD